MPLSFLNEQLATLNAAGLLRDPEDARARAALAEAFPDHLDVCSNDYLGLARSGVSRETPASDPPGAGASRLIHGTRTAHTDLEGELAAWVACPSALLYSSGYAANVGLLPCITGPGDIIYSDHLNHASIIDGCRLAKAKTTTYPHLNLDALNSLLARRAPGTRAWVVTESYYSMDGDEPDLRQLRQLCDHQRAILVVDEAHALGIRGPEGAGNCAAAGVKADVLLGTLGKAVGTCGAFIAGPQSLRTWLWNKSRAFVYSTATSPRSARMTLDHVRAVRHASAQRLHLSMLCERFIRLATAAGLPIPARTPGPIFPILLSNLDRLAKATSTLRASGILAHPVRPPTVPAGTSRLRITLSTQLSVTDIDRLVAELARTCLE